MNKYMFLNFVPFVIGLIPLALIFTLGLLVDGVPGRNKNRWPQNRGFQQIDEMFQQIGMGRAGPLTTEFVNGTAHASLVFGWATAFAPVTQWRLELAIATLVFWLVIVGVKRTVCYVPR